MCKQALLVFKGNPSVRALLVFGGTPVSQYFWRFGGTQCSSTSSGWDRNNAGALSVLSEGKQCGSFSGVREGSIV